MFNKKIGIDLGTTNCMVYLQDKGVVLNEPTMVAVSVFDKKVVAVGNEAKEMLGKTPKNIMALNPIVNGVIADYEITKIMLRYFIQKVCGRSMLFKPEVLVCISAGSSQVERRAVEDCMIASGAGVVYIISKPLASAIGAGIPIGEASGSMVLDMGGGASEAAVISLGGIVSSELVRVGGKTLDDSLALYIKKKYGLLIGLASAEKIKLEIGSAIKVNREKKVIIKGRNVMTGLPKKMEIRTNEIADCFRPGLLKILKMLFKVLEKVPPELSSDIIDKGLVMTGGASELWNADKWLAKELGFPCYCAEDAEFCVAKGIGVVLENLMDYKKSLGRR